MHRNAIPAGQVYERGGLMFLFTLAFMIFTSTFTDSEQISEHSLLNRVMLTPEPSSGRRGNRDSRNGREYRPASFLFDAHLLRVSTSTESCT